MFAGLCFSTAYNLEQFGNCIAYCSPVSTVKSKGIAAHEVVVQPRLQKARKRAI